MENGTHPVQRAPPPWTLKAESYLLFLKLKELPKGLYDRLEGAWEDGSLGRFEGGLGAVMIVRYTDTPVGRSSFLPDNVVVLSVVWIRSLLPGPMHAQNPNSQYLGLLSTSQFPQLVYLNTSRKDDEHWYTRRIRKARKCTQDAADICCACFCAFEVHSTLGRWQRKGDKNASHICG